MYAHHCTNNGLELIKFVLVHSFYPSLDCRPSLFSANFRSIYSLAYSSTILFICCSLSPSPGAPGGPRSPGFPGDPSTPGLPGLPGSPIIPSYPALPLGPGKPGDPGGPFSPGIPSRPGAGHMHSRVVDPKYRIYFSV